METTSTAGGVLHVYTLMYPGWIATVDGSPAVIETYPSLKTMLIAMPAGDHRLTLIFTETTSRRIARWISLTAWFTLALLLIVSRRRRTHPDARSAR